LALAMSVDTPSWKQPSLRKSTRTSESMAVSGATQALANSVLNSRRSGRPSNRSRMIVSAIAAASEAAA